jgi:hypothetical protein
MKACGDCLVVVWPQLSVPFHLNARNLLRMIDSRFIHRKTEMPHKRSAHHLTCNEYEKTYNSVTSRHARNPVSHCILYSSYYSYRKHNYTIMLHKISPFMFSCRRVHVYFLISSTFIIQFMHILIFHVSSTDEHIQVEYLWEQRSIDPGHTHSLESLFEPRNSSRRRTYKKCPRERRQEFEGPCEPSYE